MDFPVIKPISNGERESAAVAVLDRGLIQRNLRRSCAVGTGTHRQQGTHHSEDHQQGRELFGFFHLGTPFTAAILRSNSARASSLHGFGLSARGLVPQGALEIALAAANINIDIIGSLGQLPVIGLAPGGDASAISGLGGVVDGRA